MRTKLPLGVALAAVVVAVLGTTPLGRTAITAAVPLAKRAYLADTAKNAIRVGNLKASRTPTAGMLVPLGANGKFPPSVGVAGPAGRHGAKGDAGRDGVSGYEIRTVASTLNGPSAFSSTISCPSGKKVVGGGISGAKVTMTESYPDDDRVWAVGGTASAPTTINVYAICVTAS